MLSRRSATRVGAVCEGFFELAVDAETTRATRNLTATLALELAMVAAVGERGFTVSPAQLERWRTQLWLARTADWTDPETGELRPEIVHRAATLAGISKTGQVEGRAERVRPALV
ncbi:hypothetical protein ACFY1B_48035 [Streptomyces mirabilis]|uniref:hypothetical protein n=1 Tax=Streptomyces mirabilis TaxID=68239 RepID=UPI0036CB268A